MVEVRAVTLRYAAIGAEAAARADRILRAQVLATGAIARSEAGAIRAWLVQHKIALVAMAGALALMFARIIHASPELEARMSGIRLAFSLMAMEIGEVLDPAFAIVEKAVTALSDWFSGLPGPIQAVVVALGAGAAAVIALGAAAAIATVAAAPLAAAVLAISAPVWIVIGAIGAAVAAIVFFSKAWEENWFGIRDIVDNVVRAVKSIWGGMTSWFSEKWGAIKETLGALRGKLAEWGEEWREGFASARDRAAGFVSSLRDILGNGASSALTWGRGLLQGFWDGITEKWRGLVEWVGNAVSALPDWVKKLFGIDQATATAAAQAAGAIPVVQQVVYAAPVFQHRPEPAPPPVTYAAPMPPPVVHRNEATTNTTIVNVQPGAVQVASASQLDIEVLRRRFGGITDDDMYGRLR